MAIQTDVGKLQRGLERSFQEIRDVLTVGRLPQLLGVCGENLRSIVTSFSVGTCELDPERAFHVDFQSRRIDFERATVRKTLEVARSFFPRPGEERLSASRTRQEQAALNLLVAHELTHIVQNFPHYSAVAGIKSGLGVGGLAVLDVSADFVGATISAEIEMRLAGGRPSSFSLWLANSLMTSYVVGAFAYPAGGRSHKNQRSLGLLIGAALAQGDALGALVSERISSVWRPITPVFGFDLSQGQFNAIVLAELPGILLAEPPRCSGRQLASLWSGLGKDPPQQSLQKVATALIAGGVLDASRLLAGAIPRAG